MPAIVKPASSTAYLCEAAVRIMVDTGLLPDGVSTIEEQLKRVYAQFLEPETQAGALLQELLQRCRRYLAQDAQPPGFHRGQQQIERTAYRALAAATSSASTTRTIAAGRGSMPP